MDIYDILSSKPHNKHYLHRYIKFITACQHKNIHFYGYTENHHICPKAKDMFPEYNSFSQHPWNCAKLTARQHFIAHMMLWKVYNNRSSTLTLYYMKKVNNKKMNSRLYEKLKIERSEFIRDYLPTINKGKVNIKREDGNIGRISLDEFKNGNYKGQHSGTVMVTDGFTSFRVLENDPRFLDGELVGHTKGMAYAIDVDGNYHYVIKDDPRFSTGELRGNNYGKIYITNGVQNKRIDPKDSIPSGWEVGRSLKNSPKNSIWINNGEVSKMIKDNQIPEGWVKGRSFKKKPKHVGSKGKIWVTDGNQSKMIDSHKEIPHGWRKGRSISH